MRKPIIIGIAGGSASGKTTIARKIVGHYHGSASYISMDNYYKDFSSNANNDYSIINFDSPESFDLQIFREHLLDLTRNQAIQLPQYDFTTHSRLKRAVKFIPTPIIVIEGLFLFNIGLSDIVFDLKVYVEAPDDIRFIRRLQRDLRERNRTTESIIYQYLSTVKPMHKKYVLPNKDLSDLIINGEKPVENEIDKIYQVLGEQFI